MLNDQDMIKVILLSVPNSERVLPLEGALKNSNRFDVNKFEAVMYNTSMSKYTPNFKKQKVLYSRVLSNGETGCTISHQLIQKEYSLQANPVVILEDDARIPNLDDFEMVVQQFIEAHGEEDAVLSLLPWNSAFVKPQQRAGLSIISLTGNSPLTVGYVITPKAMASISALNSDFSYLPDWPPTETKYYITNKGVINHGDDSTTSLIDQTGRVKTKKINKLFRLTCIPYLLNRKMFSSFGEYFSFAVKPSFTWRIDNWRVR
jgi:hypothetical protein